MILFAIIFGMMGAMSDGRAWMMPLLAIVGLTVGWFIGSQAGRSAEKRRRARESAEADDAARTSPTSRP